MPALDLTPLEFVVAVLCGYLLVVLIVLSLLGGPAREIGKGK